MAKSNLVGEIGQIGVDERDGAEANGRVERIFDHGIFVPKAFWVVMRRDKKKKRLFIYIYIIII